MPDPIWLGYLFAAALMAVGVYCLVRLVLVVPMGRRSHYDVNVGHVLMAFAMVGMLVPRWNVLPVGLWEFVFAMLAVWFLTRAVQVVARHGSAALAGGNGTHLRHYLIHMVMSCTMLYMYWLGMPVVSGQPSGGSMSAMSGPPASAGDPGLTLVLLVVLLASAVWQIDGLGRHVPARAVHVGSDGVAIAMATGSLAEERPWLAPRAEVGCHVVMCVAMAYMLVLMV